jgi:hypothetical protein
MSSTGLNGQGSSVHSGRELVKAGPMEEQREFISNFIARYLEERRLPGVTRQQVQEMESVLYSVSFGK